MPVFSHLGAPISLACTSTHIVPSKLASGYSRYASPIPHTHIPPFVSLSSPSRSYRSFPPCSLCGSQVPTILLVAPRHSSWFHSFPLLPRSLPIGPLGVTPPSSVSLTLLPSIFLLGALADLYSSRYFQFVPAFWILSIRLCPYSGWSPVDLITYTHGQACSCVFCFMHSLYYSIPLPRIMHMLIPLFHPDYPPSP